MQFRLNWFWSACAFVCACQAFAGAAITCGQQVVQRTPQLGGTDAVVNTTADTFDGSCDLIDCTLREAMATAGGSATITFASPLFDAPQTITLLTALPDIAGNMVIQGPGAHLLTVRRANIPEDFRIFNVLANIQSVGICRMTIRNGAGVALGGGIYSASNLTLTDVHITGNQAQRGGGVALIGTDSVFSNLTISGNLATVSGGGIYHEPDFGLLDIANSTISGNRSQNRGGGISIVDASNNTGSVRVLNCTIANNTSDINGGGGILETNTGSGFAMTQLRSSIFASNTPNNLEQSGAPAISSAGFNLSSDAGGGFLSNSSDKINAIAALGPLANNGGRTPTHALLSNSAAIDAGAISFNSSYDQRGQPFLRIVDLPTANAPNSDGTDIGAFELQADLVFRDGFE
jgi:CSLREA domain-containing protein